VAKFALWWVKWDEKLGTYESRMTVGSRKATVEDFRARGFDRIVLLGSLGFGGPHVPESGTNQDRYNKLQEYVRALCNGQYDWNIEKNDDKKNHDKKNPNKGKSRYEVGYSDGQLLSLWISSRVGAIRYYVPIPFSYDLQNKITYEGKKYHAPPRDCPINGFDNSYWHGWIDGVLSVVDDYRVGFYWSCCLQATKYDPNFRDYFGSMCNNMEEYVDNYITFIKDMSNYIHNRGLELIWIPATGTRSAKYLKNDSGIPVIARYFDYVFIQPNYYQYNSQYTYDKLVEKIWWIHGELTETVRGQNPNTIVSIEMEADNAVFPGQNGHCASCKHGKEYKCNEEDNEKCLERACQYVGAILEVYYETFNREPIPPERAINTLFPDRAYYFGTNLEVIDTVRRRCPEW